MRKRRGGERDLEELARLVEDAWGKVAGRTERR